mmetsp:Transcript_23072/g.68057  ORF Transcript_23072/g.68057 Transcript_23072/m.68057 type:complete len:214 (+) Transcript_23072:155-796(+)
MGQDSRWGPGLAGASAACTLPTGTLALELAHLCGLGGGPSRHALLALGPRASRLDELLLAKVRLQPRRFDRHPGLVFRLLYLGGHRRREEVRLLDGARRRPASRRRHCLLQTRRSDLGLDLSALGGPRQLGGLLGLGQRCTRQQLHLGDVLAADIVVAARARRGAGRVTEPVQRPSPPRPPPFSEGFQRRVGHARLAASTSAPSCATSLGSKK